MNRITLLLSASLLLFGACQWNGNRQKDADENAPATTTESGNPYISDNQAEETPTLEEDLSFSSQAKRVLNFSGSKWVIGPAPDTPCKRARQYDSTPRPIGVKAPKPVTTTRLSSIKQMKR